jgi:hypothetical protein
MRIFIFVPKKLFPRIFLKFLTLICRDRDFVKLFPPEPERYEKDCQNTPPDWERMDRLRVAQRVQRVGARRNLRPIGIGIPVGICEAGIGVVGIHLDPILQPVAIRVGVDELGGVGVLLIIGEPVGIPVFEGVRGIQGVQ